MPEILYEKIVVFRDLPTMVKGYISLPALLLFPNRHCCRYLWSFHTFKLYRIVKCRMTVCFKSYMVLCWCMISCLPRSKILKRSCKRIKLMVRFSITASHVHLSLALFKCAGEPEHCSHFQVWPKMEADLRVSAGQRQAMDAIFSVAK